MPTHFFAEDVDFHPDNQEQLTDWLTSIAHQHNRSIEELNYIFCSDEFLLKMNQQYLNHDYYTDVITFDHADVEATTIEGDIFISIDRVRDNASERNLPFVNELNRVLAHGLLHLLGFNDKTEEEQMLMTEKEEACLSLLHN